MNKTSPGYEARKAMMRQATKERQEEEMNKQVEGVYVISEVHWTELLDKVRQVDPWYADFLSTLKPITRAVTVKSVREKFKEAQDE